MNGENLEMSHQKRQRPSNSPGQPGPGQNEGPSLKEMMTENFNKLHSKFDNMQSRFDNLEKHIEIQLREIHESVSFNASETEALKTEIKRIEIECDERVRSLSSELEKLNIYAARENLVFLGIQEDSTEDIKNVMKDFFIENLKFKEEEIEQIEYQRVHRCMSNSKPRPIKARFLRYQDKERILQKARNLKGTKMAITEDLPKSVREARKPQFRVLHAARAAGKMAYFSKSEPRKLYVDKKYVPLGEQEAFLEELQRQRVQ